MEEPARISARNQIKGQLVEVRKARPLRMRALISVIVTASIANEAVDDLGLKAGDAVAIAKASDVMVGT